MSAFVMAVFVLVAMVAALVYLAVILPDCIERAKDEEYRDGLGRKP